MAVQDSLIESTATYAGLAPSTFGPLLSSWTLVFTFKVRIVLTSIYVDHNAFEKLQLPICKS